MYMLLVTKLHRWLSFMLTNNYLDRSVQKAFNAQDTWLHRASPKAGDNLHSIWRQSSITTSASNLLEPEIARCVELFHMSSGWFDSTEPSLTTSPCTPCFHCKDVVREGSVQSNHPELMCENSTHLAISAMIRFEEVRCTRTSA